MHVQVDVEQPQVDYIALSRNIAVHLDNDVLSRWQVETLVIGSSMSYDECWQKTSRSVIKKMFSDKRNQFLWQLLSDMKAENMETDIITLHDYAKAKYSQIKDLHSLAVYICEVSTYSTYWHIDKAISKLISMFVTEKRRMRNG